MINVCYVQQLQPCLRDSLRSFPTQVSYWDVFDGSAIRELEGSQSGAINGMHISQDGKHFVTGMGHYTYAAYDPFRDFPINIIQPKIN